MVKYSINRKIIKINFDANINNIMEEFNYGGGTSYFTKRYN